MFTVYFTALQRNPVLVAQQGSLLNSVHREYSTFFTQGVFFSCHLLHMTRFISCCAIGLPRTNLVQDLSA